MGTLGVVLLVAFVIVCVLLVLLVSVQDDGENGMGGLMGGRGTAAFGANSATILTKTTFVFSDDKTYTPQNYADQYPNTEISLATAIAYSDNIYAVKTNLFLGEEILVETAKKLGIKSDLEAIPSLDTWYISTWNGSSIFYICKHGI